MPRLQLRIYINPSEAQIFCNLLRKDGNFEKITATVDTGAAVSFFPSQLLEILAYRTTERGKLEIEQAGIAKHSFQATEAYVTISLEDAQGNVTEPFEILAWFADTTTPLLGFEDVLDSAILHIDMPQRAGWIETPPSQTSI